MEEDQGRGEGGEKEKLILFIMYDSDKIEYDSGNRKKYEGGWTMKLKRLAAAALSMTMLCSAPAYAANNVDAVAVYQEMEAVAKEMTDINAFYDFRIDVTDGTENMGARLEMNMKANSMNDPENLKCYMYMRMSMDEMTGMDEITKENPLVVTGSIYMLDGMYYLDMLGSKVKYEIPYADMVNNVQKTMGTLDTSLDYMENMVLRTEGEDRVVSYTMNEGAMNDLLQTVLSMMTSAGQEGLSMSYRDVSGEYVVDSDGHYTKARTKMTIDMAAGDDNITITIDGDVGIADPGQPVEVPVPNAEEYQLLETAVQ